ICSLAAGCGSLSRKPTAPAAEAIVSPAPAVISVPQVRYVPIDKELTSPCSWVRNGALEDMPEVARGRKRCLDIYEAHLREIAAKQGGPAAVEVQP
ncbi:hypothetical protein, partial [Paraburkholderia sp. SIMBA_054]|uniref:hypothetical protein n=1 Tax=Paraburkholderia sp. SIMBA_054 TaxID=3085795 RepID=UPI00397E3F63